ARRGVPARSRLCRLARARRARRGDSYGRTHPALSACKGAGKRERRCTGLRVRAERETVSRQDHIIDLPHTAIDAPRGRAYNGSNSPFRVLCVATRSAAREGLSGTDELQAPRSRAATKEALL